MCVCVHACVRACACVRVHVCVRACACVCVRMHVCAHACVCVRACACVRVHVHFQALIDRVSLLSNNQVAAFRCGLIEAIIRILNTTLHVEHKPEYPSSVDLWRCLSI